MQAKLKDGISKSKIDQTPRHFDAETLAQSLRELAADVIRGETTDFLSRWFHSSYTDADLVLWTDSEKRIIKHQLCFFGQVVEWNPIHGTRTGFIVEEEVSADDEVSETVRFDTEYQEPVVEQAIEILSRTPALNAEEKDKLIYNLRESPRLHKKARDRALQAWAPKIDEIVSNARPTFWKRLRSWVIGTQT